MSSQKKIAFFTPTLSGGGAERMMVDIGNEFLNKGYQVDLLVGTLGKDKYSSELNSRINIIDFSSRRIRYTLLKLSLYLKEQKPDAVISTQFHANIALAISATFIGYKGKIIYRLANMLDILLKDTSLFRQAITRIGIPFSYKIADFIIAQTTIMKEEVVAMEQNLITKTIVIPNFINPKKINDLALEPVNHSWLSEKENSTPVILSAGRLAGQKDWITLLKAFQLVLNKFESRLIILGEGPQRKMIEEFVENNDLNTHISLPGFKINPFAWMAKSDLFVLSTLGEGFPNVLIQSLACNCPVVCTDVPSAPKEILENGKWGKLSILKDHKNLSIQIIESLENKNSLDLKTRADFYNQNKVIKQWIEIVESN